MEQIDEIEKHVCAGLDGNRCTIDADDFSLVCRLWKDGLCCTWVVHQHELWGLNQTDKINYIVDVFRALFGRIGV